jgi:hypothetical protein
MTLLMAIQSGAAKKDNFFECVPGMPHVAGKKKPLHLAVFRVPHKVSGLVFTRELVEL